MDPQFRDVTQLPVGQELRSVLVHIHSRGSKDRQDPSMPLGVRRPARILQLRSYNNPYSEKAGEGIFHAFLQGHKTSAIFTWWEPVPVWPNSAVRVIKVTTDTAGVWAYDPLAREIWPWGRTGRRGKYTRVAKVRMLPFVDEAAG